MGRDGCRELVSVGVAPVSVMLGWRKEEEGKDERKTERRGVHLPPHIPSGDPLHAGPLLPQTLDCGTGPTQPSPPVVRR